MRKTSIYKADGTGVRMRVLPSSPKASFTIMKKDEVRLTFSSTERALLHTGDYILADEAEEEGHSHGVLACALPMAIGDDGHVWPSRTRSLLGHKYQVTSPYMPAWNDKKRCYDYNVTLEAWYRAWAARVMRLPAIDGNGQYTLHDTDFSLTDQMQRHAYLLLLNLRLSGMEERDGMQYKARLRYNSKWEQVVTIGNDGGMQVRTVGYDMDISHETTEYFSLTTEEVKYSNTDIISAMSAISGAWDCEWWVKGDSIYFGRLDNPGKVTDVAVGTEATSVTAQESGGTYATRLYAFGGTRNIPATYRKELVFTVSGADRELVGVRDRKDRERRRKEDCGSTERQTANRARGSRANDATQGDLLQYFQSGGHPLIVNDGGRLYGGPGALAPAECKMLYAVTGGAFRNTCQPGSSMTAISPSRYRVGMLWLMSTLMEVDVSLAVYVGGSEVYSGTLTSRGMEYAYGYTRNTGADGYRQGGVYVHTVDNAASFPCEEKADGDITVVIRASHAVPAWLAGGNITVLGQTMVADIPVTFLRNRAGERHALAEVTVNATLNPLKAQPGSAEASLIVALQDGNTGTDLSSIAGGDTYTIDNEALVRSKIRASYWSSAYTDTAPNNVTGTRLMLPEGTGHVDAFSGMADWDVVEAVKVFDDIYPSRTDTVSEVRTYAYASEETDEVTGEVTKRAWDAYQFKATLASKDFSNAYKLQTGEPLRVTFSSGLLAGMTFDVEYNPTHAGESARPETNANGSRNEDATWFEIVRNEDYGTGLPNGTLRPAAGDEFTLYNYDISYISDSLLPQAEQKLLARAQAYMTQLAHNDSTYQVVLKAGWLRESGRWFGTGDRMRIDTSSYLDPVREERVIGYTVCMDIPEDAPQFTLGENARYSRLESIEKMRK